MRKDRSYVKALFNNYKSMIQIQTTTAGKQEAMKIADRLVEEKLAACAHVIGPIRSKYRWKNNIEEAEEWLVVIKTRTELYESVEKSILEMHSYETPEIIAVPIERSSADYISWLNNATRHD